jgi:GT2 family glycosyltransferase
VADLAVIVVSFNAVRWLEPCLRSVFAHAGGAVLDVVVVDNESTDGSAALVERRFPGVRVVRERNRGFAYANNRGLRGIDAPFVLFLNADTEIVSGSFGELLQLMHRRPSVGLIGCRQLTPEGTVYPTIRRFPTAGRLFFEALGAEKLPFRRAWLGERVLESATYEREVACDWTSGSFMLARRVAVLAAGGMDERFFMYCEEPDLCLRIKRAGWDVRHLPAMTIVHHVGKDGWSPRLQAQEAYARRQYFLKHFSAPQRRLAIAALALRHLIRACIVLPDRGLGRARRRSSRAALLAVLGLAPPPFGHLQ